MGMKERMFTGELYYPNEESIFDEQLKKLDLLYEFNSMRPTEQKKRQELMKEMFAEIGENCYLEPPFHANWGGAHMHLGDSVYANFNFTAVDDCAPEDNAGAGHLGTVEYNSATLYRYATVNVLELVRTLGAEQAAQTVRAFGEAFIRSMPTGKQNSFANRTLPDAVYVTLRQDQPVNLSRAFEKPVRKSEEGYAEPSKVALKQYAKELYNTFAEAPEQSFTVGTGLEELAQPMPLNTMLAVLEKAVEEKLSGNEV